MVLKKKMLLRCSSLRNYLVRVKRFYGVEDKQLTCGAGYRYRHVIKKCYRVVSDELQRGPQLPGRHERESRHDNGPRINREHHLELVDLRRFRVTRPFVCVARRLHVIVSTRGGGQWSFFRIWSRCEDAAIQTVGCA